MATSEAAPETSSSQSDPRPYGVRPQELGPARGERPRLRRISAVDALEADLALEPDCDSAASDLADSAIFPMMTPAALAASPSPSPSRSIESAFSSYTPGAAGPADADAGMLPGPQPPVFGPEKTLPVAVEGPVFETPRAPAPLQPLYTWKDTRSPAVSMPAAGLTSVLQKETVSAPSMMSGSPVASASVTCFARAILTSIGREPGSSGVT